MRERGSIEQRTAAVRVAFDDTFAEKPVEVRPERIAWIALRIEGVPYAIASRDTRGLVKLDRVVPIPSRASALRGVIGMRGAIVPVFDLGAVLGRRASGGMELRWAVLEGRESPIAFGFGTLEGVFQTDSSGTTVDGTRDVCHDGETVRAVIRLATIAQATRSASS